MSPVFHTGLRRIWKPVLVALCALAILAQPLYITPSVHGQTLAPTLVFVRCFVIGDPYPVINGGILCGVGVNDLTPLPTNPSGNVTFSACCNLTGGFFPPSTIRSASVCTLTPQWFPCENFTQGNPCTITPDGAAGGPGVPPIINPELSSCTVSYWPSIGGNQTLIANYGGDPTHSGSSGSTTFNVHKDSTRTLVSCSQDTAHTATCKAVVTDKHFEQLPPITPTGTVSWSSDARSIFRPTKCTLSGTGSTASCTVTYRERSKPGSQQINATYNGDPDHSESSASTYLLLSLRGTWDFSLSASASSLITSAGIPVGSTISLSSINGFSGSITLSTTSSPGLASSLSTPTATVTAGGSVGVVLTVSAPTDGAYKVNVTGTSESISHSISLTAIAIEVIEVTLNASPTSVSVLAGDPVNSTITVKGFTGTVTLSVSSSPRLEVTISPASLLFAPGGSATATLTIISLSSTPSGSYIVTVRGMSGAVTRSTTISVTVTGTPNGNCQDCGDDL